LAEVNDPRAEQAGKLPTPTTRVTFSPAPGPALSDHLPTRYAPLAGALRTWQEEAQTVATERAVRWGPYAMRLARWIARYEEALAQAKRAEVLTAAHQAALSAEKDLRAERLQPIVDQAKHIWSVLRQESNVDLQDIELTGSATRRALDIRAVVDQAGGSALSVMSQGELNSLALSLFLPRATLEQSPFRSLCWTIRSGPWIQPRSRGLLAEHRQVPALRRRGGPLADQGPTAQAGGRGVQHGCTPADHSGLVEAVSDVKHLVHAIESGLT
jgi:hypothetical protein